MHAYVLFALLAGYAAAGGVVGWRMLRRYCHKDERNNIVNTIVKLVIIMGYIQCMGMIILVPAVAQVDSFPKVKEHFNPKQLCKIMFAIFGIYVFIITPCLAVIYSQEGKMSNKEQCANPLTKRTNTHWGSYFRKTYTHVTSATCKKAFLKCILSISISCCLFFLTYLYFHKISLSLNADGCTQWYPYLEETNKKNLLSLNLRNIKNCQNVGEENIRIVFNLNFSDYVVMCVSLMGSIVFSLYGGVGLVSLPLGLFFSAVRRYRGGEATPVVGVNNAHERGEDLFKDQLTRINRKAEELLQITQEVELNREETRKTNFFKSLLQNMQHKREKRILNYMVHRLVVDYEKAVHRYNNPIHAASSYRLFLLFFFFSLANATIIVHICFRILRGPTGQGKLLRGWLLHWDAAQELLARKDSLSLSLLVYPLVTSYLLVCAFFGFSYICHKLKLGLLFALERKSTYLDTILMNTCLLLFVSSGAALILLRLFPAYAKQPYAFAFFDLALKNLSFIGNLYARNGLLYLILVANVLTLLLFFVPEKSAFFSVFMPATFRKILNQRGEANPGVVSDIELEGQLEVNIKRNTTSKSAGKVPTRN
ncbi:Uncharacterized protein PCOAH_00034990 [Plasmodium coatneyi]|uniref:LMBR1 domain-containing protein n=1 Tax=Plasmodium coatneyi TaxID=208452 RepID=A0A1B1E2J9_9APIC|nr:Uncharacterized protein PCOAH_00034990 [Plasmodium coatneyi]ANQ09155.1 Uncharacterized protein PCOAH_00034990 [Plasmodium coatneyi]